MTSIYGIYRREEEEEQKNTMDTDGMNVFKNHDRTKLAQDAPREQESIHTKEYQSFAKVFDNHHPEISKSSTWIMP